VPAPPPMTEARYPVTTVDLLRHGDCLGGAILRGRTDSPLSGEGWQQMRRALQPHAGWTRVVASPLQRCFDFATRFAREQDIPLEKRDDFRELDFGDWDGLTPSQIAARDPLLAENVYREPEAFCPPGGESLDTARQRIVAAWEPLIEAHAGGHLLLVVHGGTIRLLLEHLLQSPHLARYMAIPMACLTRLCLYHTPEGLYPQLLFHQPEPRA